MHNQPLPFVITLFLMISLGSGCADQEVLSSDSSTFKLSSSQLRSNLLKLQERAALKGIYQIIPIAGVANAETGLTHCWSDAKWACQGPPSSSCGGGPVIAGAGDGACWRRQGGLGMFQLDGGTYDQTLDREGNRVLTLAGNIDAGISFIIEMVRYAKRLNSEKEAIDWINGISIGSSRYNDWIDIVVQYYNGCVMGSCSIFLDRWYHYDGKTRAILYEVERLPALASLPWIGSTCQSDQDCSFSIETGAARCLKSQNNKGMCIAPCQGYCPDREGYATTFCAQAEQLEIGMTGGLCFARSQPQNSYCSDGEELTMNRYLGSSSASSRTERVCIPAKLSYDDTSSSRSTDQQSQDTPLCGGLSLPPSEAACAGTDEGLWRCACHESYEVPVSQVCRGGNWVSYRLDPTDCTRCNGVDSRGCE